MQRKFQPHVIEITVDVATMQISVDHFKKIVKVGETVQWRCIHPFFVHLGPRSPLEEMCYQDFQGNLTGGDVVVDTPVDSYKYLVAVLYNDEFLTLDPDLVVRR